MANAIVLCEIANICGPDQPEDLTVFTYGKKRYRLTEVLVKHAESIKHCIQKCEESRPRKINFKASASGQELLLIHLQTANQTRQVEFQIAGEILPIVFPEYIPSLEFEVAKQEHLHQRPLKTYVTAKLYDALYERHLQARQSDGEKLLNLPSSFQSKLRKYQERTVHWMVEREQSNYDIPGNVQLLQAIDGNHRVLKHNHCLEFYPYDGELPRIRLPPGGILADEMGLGKTVEFLAMVLLNPRDETTFDNRYWVDMFENLDDEVPVKRRKYREADTLCICTRKREKKVQCSNCRLWQHAKCMNIANNNKIHSNHICPSCWSELTASGMPNLIESKTTFIVSPIAIKMQWYHEIQKHISPSLKILLYNGLHSGSWISPLELSSYDVVLCDYGVLRQEIYHTADYKSDRQLRHSQRYMRPSSPLLMVNWWRVCLDEAQMVESSTSQAAEMVRKLPAHNRWAVTGTIDDLPPLMEFVGSMVACGPLDAWQTVDKAFQLNHNPGPLLDLLQHTLWRTCKSKVEHELGIPPQTEIVHRLELSNVESLYYREEHCKCQDQFFSVIAKQERYNVIDNSSCLATISSQLLRNILKPFLRIRQTCSIPVLSTNVSSTDYLNPHDLLMHLKSNNETECKAELRTWASSYNGLAAIYFIRKDYSQAIRHYKLLLKLAQDYQQKSISVDSVLQIHAIYNLLQASDLAMPPIKLSTESCDQMQVQLKKLEWKYLEDNTKVLRNACQAYEQKLQELKELEIEFDSSIVQVFSTLVSQSASSFDAIRYKIYDEFLRQNLNREKMENVSSVSGLIYIIDIWYQRLDKLRRNLQKEFDYLKNITNKACEAVQEGVAVAQEVVNFIRSVSDCHLADILDTKPSDQPAETQKKRRHCRLCKIRDTLNQFECLIFDKELDLEAAITDGLEKPSVEISIIKIIFAFLKTKSSFMEFQLECQNKLDTLTCLQSLVKMQIKYWIEVEYIVKAFDELEMSKMRILLTTDPEEQSNYRLLECQLDEQMEFNDMNMREAQMNFTRLIGRLKYLNHLKEDSSDKLCPICQTQDDERYVMMVCGHFVCQHCLDNMRKKTSREGVTKCPLCRQDSPQLYYSVRPGQRNSIIGDYSKKITHIVELILKIKNNDDQEKVLIFSQWQAILLQIAKALSDNGIVYRSKCHNQDIVDFKDPNLKITCLLMPLSRGSKGLNLIEATHVFLVEPILNPSDERQAIGRIHRFGQSKPTTVHRFIVNDTIEENILSLITSDDDSKTLSTHWDLENMTLHGLKKLFILKNQTF
ncbi:uncharacterized protein Dwil_GK17274 [Drosophila willistoni]|uniref:RING-type domain-containing protein n=1 Tax=Drosophila willistoni TaxID=7260 RepID=B4ML17_DROWI|nr:E3 ubiquitin-protein ligase SHPRH [Drosophila willistoni]EDW72942.1 uncharacterized protein Dwil_GK17274 [Drosophila willistoni]